MGVMIPGLVIGYVDGSPVFILGDKSQNIETFYR